MISHDFHLDSHHFPWISHDFPSNHPLVPPSSLVIGPGAEAPGRSALARSANTPGGGGGMS